MARHGPHAIDTHFGLSDRDPWAFWDVLGCRSTMVEIDSGWYQV